MDQDSRGNLVLSVIVEGVQRFSRDVAMAHCQFLRQAEEPTDAGFCAQWFAGIREFSARADVCILFKAIVAVILHHRGVDMASPGQLDEHMRVLWEAKNTPASQSLTGRNIELKIAFIEAVNASPILKNILCTETTETVRKYETQ